MKIRHLLLGLMICVVGTGAIDLSGGYLDDQNTTRLTPFLIFGHVLYDGGAPCNSPNVSITNLNTGAAWYADTVSGSDFYQTLLRAADVGAGDVLRWSATDGAVVNTTNRTIGQSDLESGGIFGFNLTLVSIAPRIIGYAPTSPVQDTGDATRRFNITINQVVDVTWLINSSPAQTNWSVTDASYTHTNVAVGVWNISARASNANGTDMQEWIWNVASATAPPPAAPFVVCGRVNYDGGGGVYNNHTVNITNLNTGTRWQAETQAGCDYYELILDSGDVGAGNVLKFEIVDGVGYNTTNHTITENDCDNGGIFDLNLTLPVLAPSVDVGLTPDDDPAMPGVQVINPDYLTTNRTVTITADVTDPDDYKNITGVIADITGPSTVGDSPVSLTFVSNSSAATARYTGRFNMSSHPVGGYEVVVNATNAEGFTGISSESFTYLHEAPAHLPLSPFIIYGSVPYTNGTPCDSPFVVVTNLNTSEELVADNQTGESFYQLVTSSAFAKAGDVLKINASKNGGPVGNATHTVNQTDIEHGATEVNINEADLSDFMVTEISFNPSEPLIGDLVTINATIVNSGAARGGAFVEMCDNKSITLRRETDDPLINDTITLPGILKIRVHFKVFRVDSDGNITIYNETQLVEELPRTRELKFDHWAKWCDGGAIRIESRNAWFIVDRYEAVLADENITLGVGNSTSISVVWNLSDQYMGWEYNGTHDITVRVDPYNQVVESNETNNERTETIDVHPSLDFAVTNISLNVTKPVLGDVVGIDATISNYGVGNGTAVVKFFYDNISTGDDVLLANEIVTLNGIESKVISASWLTGAAYGGVGDHNITVRVDPDDALVETNETNNTLRKHVFVNGTDLTVTNIKIPCGDADDLDNPCYVGQDVNVTATIANIGAADATNFTVEFRNGTCSDDSGANTGGANFSKVRIDRLNSGESRDVSGIWNPAEPLNRMITASIPYDEYTDNDETNNEWFECAWVKERYDFTVERVNVTPQDGVRRGESVNITATIGSTGYGGGNVSIAFFVNSTDFAGTCGERFIRIGTIDDVDVEVGETETVSTTWDVDVAGGCHLIAAVVNPDNKVEESEGTFIIPLSDTIRFRGETGNNVKNCTLHVNPLDLDITEITLVPSEPNIGDIVNISAKIGNSAEANSTVRFYVEKGEHVDCVLSGSGCQSWSLVPQPEDVPIRVHLAYIKIKSGDEVNASVTDSEGEDHPVHFYVKCKKYGGQDMKVDRIKFETDCHDEVAGGYRYWGDIWTEWTNGTTVNMNALSDSSGSVRLSIDKYQVLLGNETVTLSAGESIYHSTWNASPPLKAGEYYTFMANVEDQKRYSNETYLGGTDLAITNLSVMSVVWDGDRVWVNATIENLGRMNATDFLVNFTEVYRPKLNKHPDLPDQWITTRDPHLELIDTTRIEGLDAGSSINIPVPWNGSVRDIVCTGTHGNDAVPPWTEHSCDDYDITVEIIPLENEKNEENANNYNIIEKVHVDKSRDFEVTDLLFRVNSGSRDPSELLIYDDVTLNATLDMTNLANQGGVVNVGFYIDEACDEHEIGNTTVAFPVGNGTGYAEIEWKVENFDGVDIAGEHNMTVVVDPENRIYEIDGDRNNTYTQPINVMASDLLVESLDIHPRNPERGETVSIDATITNHGDADASNITLTIYDWAKRHIEDVSEQSGPGREQIEIPEIPREDAAAMRLYLDLEIDGGRVCINDGSGREIIHYDRNFHGWTPWVLDNSTTIVVNETDSAYAKVSWVYYLASSSIIDISTHDLGINETRNITVNWNPSTVGERLIAAIIDPEDRIIEHDEVNNRLAELIQVQTADLLVSDLSLAWHNGTEIGENEIIKDGDDVRISANLANIGVEDAGSFDVRLLVDDLLIKNERRGGLAPDGSISVSADWHVTVGDHLLKIEADYRNEVDETNETNNIAALERYIFGAELSGNTSWETRGLHGEILFPENLTQPYDGDEVNITARITNSGYLDATDFNVVLFFDYTPSCVFSKRCGHIGLGGTWENETYPGAEYLYLKVTTPVTVFGECRRIIKDDVIIYDGDGNEAARPVAGPEKPCWVRVNGDTTKVLITHQGGVYGPVFDIYCYPIYQNGTSMLFEGIDVPVNSSRNLLMKRNVSAGDRTVMLIIDPENKVPEDEDYRKDNTVSRIMHVKPTRDFTVMNVTGERTNLSDLDRQTITAGVSNIGLRNGTADVSFVDCEIEYRTYKYHFDTNRSLSYLPIPPDVRLLKSGYEDLMIIHRPGVDAIDLHFNSITLRAPVAFGPSRGKISICDENGSEVWYAKGPSMSGEAPITYHNEATLVPGETAYIYRYNADFDFDGYITGTEVHREEVRLNATKTWNESKNITSMWTAYTGDHIIAVILDGDDRITEINESNNANINLFHVNASRDAAIAGINITPERPEDGENVDITAVITNNGSENASFTVDLWANLTRNKPDPDESLPDANLTTDLGGDRIRYITLLNHTTVKLAPGKNTTVNATWNDISIDGSPKYHIIAIVDPTDEIDEINESNNEIVKEIIMDYPDLTIGTAHVPGGAVKPVVPIREIGGASASNVTVRFEAYETEECTKSVRGRKNKCSISHQNASNMRVYFNGLYSMDGIVYVNDRYSSNNPIEEYKGTAFSGVWSPWVEGGTVWIISMGGTTHAEIDKYNWGNVSDEQIDELDAGGDKDVEMPSWEYECPRSINVSVDPDNNITELDETNNNETVLMYADLWAGDIVFVSPSATRLTLDAEKFIIDGYIRNWGFEDGIIVPVSDFNVTLEFRNRYPNGTVGDAVFNVTKPIEDPLCADKKWLPIQFEFDPSEKFEVDGNYTVRLIVDSTGDVCESNELYPSGENNNYTSKNIRVDPFCGYTGGGSLVNYEHDVIHGGVIYTLGDSKRLGSFTSDRTLTVNFDDVIPAKVKFARLYLYVDTGTNQDHTIALPIEVDMEFNGYKVQTDRRYTDVSVGSRTWNVTYGLYCYDVTRHIDVKKENVAVATRISPKEWEYGFGIAAIGLLIVWEDDDALLTKYWINEGIDVVMAKNWRFPTGLSFEDCIVSAEFNDVEQEDLDGVNATLMTILSLFSEEDLFEEANGEGDVLKFNGHKIGTFKDGSHWIYQRPEGAKTIAMTDNKWEHVTDDLKRGSNLAAIQSKGNYIVPSNAFLRLIFPPDLNVIDLTAPSSTVVGAHHSINATIRNDGRSDAHDFNVTFHIDGKQMVRIPHLDLPAGENMTIHLYNWTPMLLLHSYNLTVAADVLSGEDWTEVETDNNAMTKHVIIEEGGFGNQTGPRGTGGGRNPTGGEYTETITGRVMEGMTFSTFGGGGGAGMFSALEWIVKGAVWLVLLLFVCAGYRMEQRNYGGWG